MLIFDRKISISILTRFSFNKFEIFRRSGVHDTFRLIYYDLAHYLGAFVGFNVHDKVFKLTKVSYFWICYSYVIAGTMLWSMYRADDLKSFVKATSIFAFPIQVIF